MLFLMIVSLYTSRVILNELGVEDFGIYNVVAGLVTMFSLITASITVAITRFITFELGKSDNIDKLRDIFSCSINVQLIIIIIVIVLGETLGLWFVNNKLIIPELRLFPANLIYQFSLISFILSLIIVPYNATILAHEKMSAYAYISIIDAFLKLMTAISIKYFIYDKLAAYGMLIMLVSIIITIVYMVYCKCHFSECSYKFTFNKSILFLIFSYSGWTYIGASGALLRDQGGNILINLFFGPNVNAARGISVQVQNAVNNFAQNFLTAINPQIIKDYASGQYEQMHDLIMNGARFGYYLVLIISLPLLFNTEYVLNLWLGDVPRYSVLFVRLCVIFVLSETISTPLITAASATGNIRNYQLVVGGIQFLNFPISYICLKNSYPVYSIFVVAIIISQICLYARIIMLKHMVNLNCLLFLKESIIPIIIVTVISLLIPFVVSLFLQQSFLFFFISSLLCVFSTVLSVYMFGLKIPEKNMLEVKLLKLRKRVFR